MTRIPLEDPRFCFNRHLQWLAFKPRNLYERVEVLFPIKNPGLRERICTEILPAYLAGNRKARLLGPDGVYTRPLRGRGRKPFIAEEQLMNQAGGGVNRSANGHKTNGQLAYTENAEAISSSATASPEHDSQDSSNATV
jgi:hypothetical protein